MATTEQTLRTLPWDGLFDAPPETEAPVTEASGTIPEGLVGTLYRNGPGRLDLADHLFDGDGCVSMIRFTADGTAEFRNRYVRTRKYALELAATKPRVSGYGTRAAGGVLRNAFRPPTGSSNAANTSVMFSAGRLLALWEAGRPYELDPETLETLGEMDFDGALQARTPFSAHPHWDPNTREIFNFGMLYGPTTRLATHRIDRSGRLHRVAVTKLPAPVMNHDFIITDRWLVFCLGPIRMNLLRFLSGRASFGDSLDFHADEPTRIVLVPRSGGDAVTIEAAPWFQFHFAAAFDDGEDVVIDLVRYDDYESLGRHLKAFRTATFEGVSSPLFRYRVTPTSGRVEGRPLTDANVEFPQVDGRRVTGGYSTIYAAMGGEQGGLFTGIGRVDVERGVVDAYEFGTGHVVSEPLFVPRPGSTAEDDGWLLGTVYDPQRRASDAFVLDARALQAGPVWSGRLPVNTGLSFHGTWRPA